MTTRVWWLSSGNRKRGRCRRPIVLNWQELAILCRRRGREKRLRTQRGLVKLFPNGELRGARILDVGYGSGLSMTAALRLGASQVDSIEAARGLLSDRWARSP